MARFTLDIPDSLLDDFARGIGWISHDAAGQPITAIAYITSYFESLKRRAIIESRVQNGMPSYKEAIATQVEQDLSRTEERT